MADLVAAVEHAEQYGNANPYWGWSSEVRQEYREFHAAKHAATHTNTAKQRAPVPEPTAEEESTVQSDDEASTEQVAEDEQQGEDDTAEARTEVEPTVAAAQPKRQRSAKQQRYQDYLSIARDELKKENPSRKTIPHGECHAKCKELLTEDGWI